MSRFAREERLALAALMDEAGPDAPTLCDGWTVKDLLAHLLLRERRPDAALGILFKRFAGHTSAVQKQIATSDFAGMLTELRNPPWWNPVTKPPLDELANLTEMFVHLEDVRRASPTWTPRQLSRNIQTALWKMVPTRSRLSLRKFPATIHLESPGFGAIRSGSGGPDVITISGEPGELILFLFGRQAQADVQITGPANLTDRLLRARLGL